MAKQKTKSDRAIDDNGAVTETNRLPKEERSPSLLPNSLDLTMEEGAVLLAALQTYWDSGIRHPAAAQWAMAAQRKLQAAGAALPKG